MSTEERPYRVQINREALQQILQMTGKEKSKADFQSTASPLQTIIQTMASQSTGMKLSNIKVEEGLTAPGAHVVVRSGPAPRRSTPIYESNPDFHYADSSLKGERDKIIRHCWYPALKYLLTKAEEMTCQYRSDITSQDVNSHLERILKNDCDPVDSGDPELNELMGKALEVLKVHVMELERVNDLCKDFCERYIGCLKVKLNANALLGAVGDESETEDMDETQHNKSDGNFQVIRPAKIVTSTPQATIRVVTSGGTPGSTPVRVKIIGGAKPGGINLGPQTSTSTPRQILIAKGDKESGNQIMYPAFIIQTPQGLQAVYSQGTPKSGASISIANTSSIKSETRSGGKVKKNRRGALSGKATQILKSWLFQHIVHPYPSEEEKRQLAQQGGLSLVQVNNWFINARRRILQPMLGENDPQLIESKSNKSRQKYNRSNLSAQRFWPRNLSKKARLEKSREEDSTDTDSDSDTDSDDSTADSDIVMEKLLNRVEPSTSS